MKRLLYMFVGFLSISCQPSSNEKDLTNRIDLFNEAFEEGEVDVLASMITENYVHTNSSWKSFGKEQWLEYIVDRSEKINRKELILQKYQMDEINIQFHKSSAIVTGKILVEGIDKGTSFSKQFRVTNLWVFENDKWLRAGFHDTAIE